MMRTVGVLLSLASMAAAILPSSAIAGVKASAALTTRHKFDIAAQPLGDALRALAAQSGLRILFPYDAVANYRGRAIRGWMSTAQALDQLLVGTSLHHSETASGVIALATVPPTRVARRTLAVQFAQAAAPIGNSAIAPQAEEGAQPIIVTGTRQSNRTVADSMAPIDVLTKADLDASGKQSVRDLLATLIPSINVSNGGAGASFAVKTLSLRGLSGDQLLVLVNGKRRHNSATLYINGTTQNGQSPPDLDLIAASGIERIEVLRDGASAQYGSDAIAGVINIITRKGRGGGVTMLGGATRDGGGATGRVQGDYGIDRANGSYFHAAFDAHMQGRTIRGVANPTVFYSATDPREPAANSPLRLVNKPGQPQVSGLNLSYDLMLPVGERMEFYSFGTASKRHADAYLTFRTPNATNNIPEVFVGGYSPHLHIHDQDYQGVLGLRGDLSDMFHFDLSSSYARNLVDYTETTALNASLGSASPTAFYIGTVRSTEWTSNLDLQYKRDVGLSEPLFIAAGLEYRENSYAIVPGEPASYIDGGYRSPAGTLNAGVIRQAGSQGVTGFPPSAAGLFRRNARSLYLNLEQTIIPGLDIALAGRHEHYSDFGRTDTGKASLRFEPVRGFAIRGTASTGFRAPTLQQIHYASSSTIGVLLPGASVATLAPVRALPVNDPVAIALGAQPLKPEKSTNYSAGIVVTPNGRLNLTVDTYQIDIDDRILLGGTLTGAVASAAGQPVVYNAVGRILQAAGLAPVQSGFYFSNAASTRTRGLDIVGTWRANLGHIGSAVFTLSANFNKTRFTRLDVPAVLAAVGLALIDRARQGDFTKGTPRNKFVANMNWIHGALSLNVRATRYGEVTQVAATQASVNGLLQYVDEVVRPKILFDYEAGYAITPHIRASIGANNIFNIYPSILNPVNQGAARFAYYNTYSPYGISGGFYYGKLSFTF